MKKIFNLLIIMTVVTTGLTGCGEKKTEVKSHKIDNQEIKYQESNSNSNSESNVNIVEEESNSNSNVVVEVKSNTTKSNTTSNKTSNTTKSNTTSSDEYSKYNLDNTESYVDTDGNTILYRKYNIPNKGTTFSVITCLNKSNKEVWKYTTKTVSDTQYPIIDFVGGADDRIYLKENNNLVMIDTKSGKVIQEFKNVGLESAATNYRGMYSYDGKDYIPLYAGISSMYRLVVVDSSTKTIIKNITIPDGYYEMHLIGGKISVYSDVTGNDVKYEFDVTDVIKPGWDFSKIES